jgi:hypothetical protein
MKSNTYSASGRNLYLPHQPRGRASRNRDPFPAELPQTFGTT